MVKKWIKGDSVKFVDEVSTLADALLNDGWHVEGEEPKNGQVDELAALRAQAEAMGLKPHHKAGAEKIRELIEEAKK